VSRNIIMIAWMIVEFSLCV